MPERSIEALVVTVLPWPAGIDLNGLDTGLLGSDGDAKRGAT